MNIYFFGYHRHPDGRLSDAETKQAFINIGDIIVKIPHGVDEKGKITAEGFRLFKNLECTRTSVILRLMDTSSPSHQQKCPTHSAKVAVPYSTWTIAGSAMSQNRCKQYLHQNMGIQW
jgi:hypothetical protein